MQAWVCSSDIAVSTQVITLSTEINILPVSSATNRVHFYICADSPCMAYNQLAACVLILHNCHDMHVRLFERRLP